MSIHHLSMFMIKEANIQPISYFKWKANSPAEGSNRLQEVLNYWLLQRGLSIGAMIDSLSIQTYN